MPRSFLIKKHHHLGCGLSTAELLDVAMRAEKEKLDRTHVVVVTDYPKIVVTDEEAEEEFGGPYDLSTKSPESRSKDSQLESSTPVRLPPSTLPYPVSIAKPLPLTPLNLNTQYSNAYGGGGWSSKAFVPQSFMPFNFPIYAYNQHLLHQSSANRNPSSVPTNTNRIVASSSSSSTENLYPEVGGRFAPSPIGRPEVQRYNEQPMIDIDASSTSPTPTPSSPSSSAESDTSTSAASSSKKSRRSDDDSTRLQCIDCGKSYSTFSGLTKHKQFHCVIQREKSFKCKFCEKVYVSLGALKMHIRTHTLPCKCHLCGKAFSRPWLLQGHIRTHTGEKPFACSHCNRAFADRSNLRAHLQTHSDIKKYCCQGCSKTFSRMSLLLKHEDNGCPAIRK
ncbi:SNAI2 (predicted) [Pycnogonum litorale]